MNRWGMFKTVATIGLIVGAISGAAAADETQACCEFDGTCNERTELACAGAGGTPQGPGTTCAGDSNSNGIDDACDTQACCGAGETGCEDLLPSNCDGESGGVPAGVGTVCLGDSDENGTDDACEAGSQFDAYWLGGVGVYDLPAGWDINDVPCNGTDAYNVFIDAPGSDVTITGTSCAVQVLTLVEDATFNIIDGASYTVVGGATLHGDLHVGTSGFDSANVTDLDDASITVAGGSVSILGATSYAREASGDNDTGTFAADGGLLDLAAISSITQTQVGTPSNAALRIASSNNGTVDLSLVATITGGATQIVSSGVGSEINLESLTSLVDSNPASQSYIQASQGSDINILNLAALDGIDLFMDGSGTIDTVQMTSYLNGVATVTGGPADFSGVLNATGSTFDVSSGVLDLGHATDLTRAALHLSGTATADTASATAADDLEVVVSSGATVTIPAATYAHAAQGGGDYRTLQASAASQLVFPALTTITQTHTGSPSNAALRVRAESGGSIDLAALNSITGGATQVTATGGLSAIDLSGLTVWTDTNTGTTSRLQANSGGSIDASVLASMSHVQVDVGSGSQILLPQDATITGGALLYGGGSLGATALNLIDSNLTFSAGPTGPLLLRSRGVSSLAGSVPSDVTVQVIAEGATAATMTAASGFANAGRIELQPESASQRSTLAVSSGTLTNSANGELILAAGQGGGTSLVAQVNNQGVWSIATSSASANVGRPNANHTNAGTLTFSTSTMAPLVCSGSSFTNASGGVMTGAGAVVVTGLDFSNGGLIQIEGTPASVAFTGGFSQVAGGILEMDLGGPTPGAEHDYLQATGTASIAGELQVTLTGAYDPPVGTVLTIVSASAVQGAFDSVSMPALSGGRCLDVAYTTDEVQVVATIAGIAQQPQDQLACEGATAAFSVTPISVGDYSYQWRKDGQNISQATEAMLVFDPVALSDQGTYDVIVTNACGSEVSVTADLTVTPSPAGDLNHDCVLDVQDVPPLVACLGGPSGGVNPGCGVADLDDDGDVDMQDFGMLQILIVQ